MSGLSADERGRLLAILDAQPASALQRVLVTATRTWDDDAAIGDALDLVESRLSVMSHPRVLVHGDSGRGDRAAERWAYQCPGWWVTPYPADWDQHGKAAGPVRNAVMVAAGVDLCLAFIAGKSRGASGCAAMAERAGIPTWRCLR